jgi:hypothetical protein
MCLVSYATGSQRDGPADNQRSHTTGEFPSPSNLSSATFSWIARRSSRGSSLIAKGTASSARVKSSISGWVAASSTCQRRIAPPRSRSGTALLRRCKSKIAVCLDSRAHQKGEPVSDLATLHQSVDIALSLSLIEAVLSGALRHEIVVVLERGRSWSENLPHFERISLQTVCLILTAASSFAAVTLEATFAM